MVVAKNQSDQNLIRDELIRRGIRAEDILVMTKEQSIFMTQEAVDKGRVHDYRVVIVTPRLAEGYTLSYFHTMVTSVYPSAQSTREQLIGRLNRMNQLSKTIDIFVVHCGILSHVLEKHQDASSISQIISSLAEQVRR